MGQQIIKVKSEHGQSTIQKHLLYKYIQFIHNISIVHRRLSFSLLCRLLAGSSYLLSEQYAEPGGEIINNYHNEKIVNRTLFFVMFGDT